MSFWNNPENNSIKTLLVAVVLIGAGAFAYYAMNNGANTGRVIGAPSAQTVNTVPAGNPAPEANMSYVKDPKSGATIQIQPGAKPVGVVSCNPSEHAGDCKYCDVGDGTGYHTFCRDNPSQPYKIKVW